MKAFFSTLIITLFSIPVLAQGLQDGAQGSGGDEQAEYTVGVIAQWNMVSVPITVGDYIKTSLFPTATSGAIAYQGGSFVTKDTLDNGPAYWLKFPAPQSLSLTGSLIYTDSIPVNTGWNMVGSISDPVASSSVTAVGTTVLTSFFSFNNGYQIASSIDPGLGYWVKTSSPGTLVMSSGSFPKRSAQDSLETVLASLNTLTITDAAGGSQTLYFGQTDARMHEMAELPPVPPSGIFDARFASHSMIASGDESILLSSVVFPVEVQWAVTTPGNYTLVIGDKETPLNTTGSARLSQATSHLSLRIGSTPELPREFGLSQNYPNPFNPTTSITFALPVQSQVRVELYTILGQRVATVVNDELPAGYHTVSWNGLGDNNQQLGTGVYMLRLTAHGSGGRDFSDTRKLMLLK